MLMFITTFPLFGKMMSRENVENVDNERTMVCIKILRRHTNEVDECEENKVAVMMFLR